VPTLESLAQQLYRPLEIIVVDDASTEGYEFLVYPFRTENLSLHIHRLEQNSGPGAARQAGLLKATGQFIQFLDSDDLIHPHKILDNVKTLLAHPDWLMTYSTTEYADARGKPQGKLLGLSKEHIDRILPQSLVQLTWQTSSCLWNQAHLRPQAWHPLRAAEDHLFDWIQGLQNIPIGHTSDLSTHVYKRIHDQSLSEGMGKNLKYQGEILKSYQIFSEYLTETGLALSKEKLQKMLAKKCSGKYRVFLSLGDFEAATNCIELALKLNSSSLDVIEKLLYALAKYCKLQLGWTLLYRYKGYFKKTKKKIPP